MTENDGLLGLAALALALSCVLLAILVDGGLGWPRKLFAVLGCFVALSLGWLGLRDLLGHPTEAPLPASSRIVASHVQQPDKRTRQAGAIVLWVLDLEQAGTRDEAPRAHRLPYDLDLHRRLNDVQTGMEKGDTLLARRAPARRATGATTGQGEIELELIRRRQLPPKGPPGGSD